MEWKNNCMKNKLALEEIYTSKYNRTMYRMEFNIVHYFDIEKAFDSIHRESLWSIMKLYDIPDKLVRMVKLLYESFQCAVLEDGEESDWFWVTTGVKQGCTMSGFLFLLVADYIMKRTTEREPTGIGWIFTTKLEDLDFTDDLALLSSKFQGFNKRHEDYMKMQVELTSG
ncbi:uncharacterized protein LOC130052233 [Ostrea edulis]|uniref:uncharacterized protein LOC130052233 n=1 Tax=Ostrea edulis TaxID=37623 RepID=UPI0024AFEFF1|nr:uncharacterized protein LOC130052233 [Ostrea edulis]